MMSSSAQSLVGQTVGDFAIDEIIGGGAFGTVYRGRQLGLERPVAIKVPTYEIASDPITAERFAREAKAAARVHHPGVVAIYGVGELPDGRPYLAMQLLDGEPLDRVLANGPLPPLRALKIARSIASALSETHAADVVHRDLKPTNIMWRRDRNGDDRITLVDFGIAVCRPGGADAARLTSSGLIGTPHYMSPEQAHGDPVDGRADLYALGCLLFELVTGKPPFTGSGMEVLLAHMGQPAPVPSAVTPGLPASVDKLVAHLLAKRPDDRPASADAVVALLDDAIADVESARSSRRSQKKSVRTPLAIAPTMAELAASPAEAPVRRWPLWLAGAGIAIVLAGGGVLAWRAMRDDDAAASPEDNMPAKRPTDREIVRDDGELIVRTLVPDPVRAGVPATFHASIRTKLGGAFAAQQVVVTIEDPHGIASGFPAHARGDKPGHYVIRHTFPEAGHYVIRVFPSETETVSTFDLEVRP